MGATLPHSVDGSVRARVQKHRSEVKPKTPLAAKRNVFFSIPNQKLFA